MDGPVNAEEQSLWRRLFLERLSQHLKEQLPADTARRFAAEFADDTLKFIRERGGV